MRPILISPRGQSGFGLIELMIAMTLGLVLLGGIGYMYIGSRGAFRTTDNLSRMQENARYALDTMSRDIRMAGYVGCGNMASVRVNTIANAPVPPMTPGNALIGYDGGTGWANPTSDYTGSEHGCLVGHGRIQQRRQPDRQSGPPECQCADQWQSGWLPGRRRAGDHQLRECRCGQGNHGIEPAPARS